MLNFDRKNSKTAHSSLARFRMSLSLVSCVLLLAACTADAGRMVVSSAASGMTVGSTWQHNLCLRRVEGGDKWNPLSQAGVVEDAAFREALEKSLAQSQLLSQPNGCKYYLDVDILGVSQPGQGMFVTSVQTISHVNYKVLDGNQRLAFVDTVSSSYTEDFSLLPAVARMQRASEGAVRTNFEQFLQHLSQKLPAT